MFRRSAGLAGRIGRHVTEAVQSSADVAAVTSSSIAESSGRSFGTAPVLQIVDRWQQGGSRTHFPSNAFQGFHFRNFSSSNSSPDVIDANSQATPLPNLTEVLDPTAIVKAATLAEPAAIAQAGVDVWLPTQGIQQLLVWIHDATGLEWWSSIMLTTAGVRMLTLPVILYQTKNTYKMSQARPEIEKLLEHMKQEQARGNPDAMAEYQQRVMAVWAKYDCNPLKSMGSLFLQFPIFVGFFSALRSFAAVKVPSLVEGGTFWFTDLTVADPYYALPLISSLTFLLTVEVGAADGMEGQPDKVKSRMKNAMRFLAVVMVPLTASMPAGVFCYWTASNIFSLFQAMVMKVPLVKKALKLPDLKTAHLSPEAKMVGKPVVTYAHPPPSSRRGKGEGGVSRLERALGKAAAKAAR